MVSGDALVTDTKFRVLASLYGCTALQGRQADSWERNTYYVCVPLYEDFWKIRPYLLHQVNKELDFLSQLNTGLFPLYIRAYEFIAGQDQSATKH
jgi:hypothetical protein